MRQILEVLMVLVAVVIATRLAQNAPAENVQGIKRLYGGMGQRVHMPRMNLLRPAPLRFGRLALSG